MYPRGESLAEVDLEPPDERPELLLLVRRQLGQLALAGLQLCGVVHEIANHKLVLASLVYIKSTTI